MNIHKQSLKLLQDWVIHLMYSEDYTGHDYWHTHNPRRRDFLSFNMDIKRQATGHDNWCHF